MTLTIAHQWSELHTLFDRITHIEPIDCDVGSIGPRSRFRDLCPKALWAQCDQHLTGALTHEEIWIFGTEWTHPALR